MVLSLAQQIAMEIEHLLRDKLIAVTHFFVLHEWRRDSPRTVGSNGSQPGVTLSTQCQHLGLLAKNENR